MKKVLSLLLVMLPVSSILAFSAITPSGHTLMYQSIGNNEVTVSRGYAGAGTLSGSLIIPDTVISAGQTYIVVGISDDFSNNNSGYFENQYQLTSVILPSTMRYIGSRAFQNCSNLSVISMNDGLQRIGYQAFAGCSNLTVVSIPATVTSLGYGVFLGCTSLTQTNIPSSVSNIGQQTFNGCSSLTQISIPNSVINIGTAAFSGCTSLQNLVLPNALQYISNSLCQNCTSLENVTIPNTVAYIQTNAFSGCSNLFSVTVPNTVLSIETNAFSNVCNVVYNGTATGAPWGAAYVNGYVQDSILYSDNTMTTLVKAHHSIHTVNIPSSVNTIANAAFQNCTNITNVSLGNNITAIPNQMFDGCTNLSASPLTNYIQTIGQHAFRNTSISTVTIPQSCTYIGAYAFYGSPVSMVDAQPIVPPSIGSGVFSSSPTITVPCGSASAYQNAWYQYQNLITEPTVDFELTVLASEGGQAYVTSEISCVDSTATISATNDYGYHFDHWSDGNTDNPRTIHVTSDTTVTAIFAPNRYTITVQSSNEAMGSTTGCGTYLYGDTATLVAIPVDHYHFLRWRTANYYGYETSVHENPLSLVVTNDMVLTADFAIDTYYVNVVPNEVTRGSVTGGGYVEYGQPITVSATSYSGYQFVRWSNGAEYNPYTFAVTSDMTLEAVFMEEGTVYHVEATSDNSVMGTVTGGGPYATGETAVLTAVAYPGYHFIRWQDNVTENPRSYLVTHDASFVAYFEPNVGIGEIEDDGVNVYVNGGRIIVKNVNGMVVRVYDMMGRLVATASGETVSVPMPVGVYLVKVGTLPARKVVVIR